MVQLSLILIWLIIKIANSSNSTIPVKKEIISNPESPMYNWNNSDLDSEIIFPWEDVFKCRIIHDYNCNLSLCPRCFEENQKSIRGEVILPDKFFEKFGEVITVYFKGPEYIWKNLYGPEYTWKELYGQEGYLSICIKHKRQIGFDYTVLN